MPALARRRCPEHRKPTHKSTAERELSQHTTQAKAEIMTHGEKPGWGQMVGDTSWAVLAHIRQEDRCDEALTAGGGGGGWGGVSTQLGC